MALFEITGFAMLTLTTKKIDGKFFPVGEESFAAVIKTEDGFVIILVDEGGFTKAQTKPLDEGEAKSVFQKVFDSGIDAFSDNKIKIWNDVYPTVQNELKILTR